MAMPVRLRRLLARPAVRWWPAVVGVVLCLPSLRVGYILDDHFHQFMLQNRVTRSIPVMVRQTHELYSFMPSDPAFHRYTREVAGTMPWYAAKDIRAEFMRPLASWSLYLDWLIAPGSALFAHVQSLLWMAALMLAPQQRWPFGQTTRGG